MGMREIWPLESVREWSREMSGLDADGWALDSDSDESAPACAPRD